MKRNSTTIYIESPSTDYANPCITPVLWSNNAPNFTGITEPTLSILKASWESDKNNIVVIPDSVPQPIVLVADWAALNNEILDGSLKGIYNRLLMACIPSVGATLEQIGNAARIAFAAGKLDQSVGVTGREGAVAASLQLLVGTSDYRFTQAEKDLWITKAAELNFTSLVYLP